MKLAIISGLVLLYGLFNIYSLKMNLVILPKHYLNKQFSVVASVSESDSINDIIARPLYSNKMSQFYFKQSSNSILLMEPNIGLKLSKDYAVNYDGIQDRIIYRLPKLISFGNYVIFNIKPILDKKFFFHLKDRNYFMEKRVFLVKENSINMEANFYNKKILYSILFHTDNRYKTKISNMKHGFFVTLTKKFNISGSMLKHYITRWDCNEKINVLIDKSVPKKLLSTFKSGIEEWNKSLKKANPKCRLNAITYLDKEWRQFRNGDSKFTSISLAPSTRSRTYAVGHFDFDWRNGKIFRGNIMVSGNWIDYWSSKYDFLNTIRKINLKLYEKDKCYDNLSYKNQNYNIDKFNFVKAGLKSVIIHEVGHILGLRHNFKASSLVPYEQIFNQSRIDKEGLIPSIMDYLNLVVNFKEIYNCYNNSCLMNNIRLMDGIGSYDDSAIQFGYGNGVENTYLLGSDEMKDYDPMSNTGDISDLPSKYYNDNLLLSKYVIDNFHLLNETEFENFDMLWKKKSKLVETHYRSLMMSIEDSLHVLTGVSYSLDGKYVNIVNSQEEALEFLKNVLKGKYYLKNKDIFVGNQCSVMESTICQGMAPLDLSYMHKNLYFQLKNLLYYSEDLGEKIVNNNILSNSTISIDNFMRIMNQNHQNITEILAK